MTVADVGAGVGYLLPTWWPRRPARHGDRRGYLPRLRSQAEGKVSAAGWRNVRTILGTEYDAKLPPAQVDVALVLDTYHHFNYPIEMLKSIRRALKPGGQLVIIEYYRSRRHPGTTMDDVREHIRLIVMKWRPRSRANGFHFLRTFDHLPHEYVLMFDRKPAVGKAAPRR